MNANQFFLQLIKPPIFLWLGIFIAISFLETPLKFQVPGITLAFALSLGKIMFGISTNIQIGFCVFILLAMAWKAKKVKPFYFSMVILLFLLLIAQKFWMLSVLDERADLLIQNKPAGTSNLHDIFIYSEVFKLLVLLFLGFSNPLKAKYPQTSNLEHNQLQKI